MSEDVWDGKEFVEKGGCGLRVEPAENGVEVSRTGDTERDGGKISDYPSAYIFPVSGSREEWNANALQRQYRSVGSIECCRLVIRMHREQMCRWNLQRFVLLGNIQCHGGRECFARINLPHDGLLVDIEEEFGLVVQATLAEVTQIEILCEKVLWEDGMGFDLPSFFDEIVPSKVRSEVFIRRRASSERGTRELLGDLDGNAIAFECDCRC